MCKNYLHACGAILFAFVIMISPAGRKTTWAMNTDSTFAQTLIWNTFFGAPGYGDDHAKAICADRRGNIYIVGYSEGTWGDPIRPYGGGDTDAFVAKLNSSGTLLWMTFLGGSGADEGRDIISDEAGYIYVTGTSPSTWAGPIVPHGGSADAFAAKLSPTGALQWNTFLGGPGSDQGYGLGLDGSSNLYLTGTSGWSWGSPIRSFGGGGADAFAAKLNPNGALQWNTFLGSDQVDYGNDLAVDGSGNATIAGSGASTWGTPLLPFSGGFTDAFAAELNTNGVLQWNTFLGGSGDDYGSGIALGGTDDVYVTGSSSAGWGSPVLSYTAGEDAFAANLNGSGLLQWNTFIGGGGPDNGFDLVVDESGFLFVTGQVDSSGGRSPSPSTLDIFATKLDSNGGLQWNSQFGGNGIEEGLGITVALSGAVYVTGDSFATWGNPILPYNGGCDGFAVRINDDVSLTVTVPNGGESLVGGSTPNIAWTTTGSIENVKIEFSADGGATWTTIAPSAVNSGSYAWNVPAVVSANGLIRISEAQTGQPMDTCDESFTVALTSPVIGLSKTALSFGAEQNGTPPPAQFVAVTNIGVGTLGWAAVSSETWLAVAPAGGTGDGFLTVGVVPAGLAPGTYQGTVTVTDPNAVNSPQTVTVTLQIYSPGTDAPPFGFLDAPLAGAMVSSSIPVTGWSLDDLFVESVKIYLVTGDSGRMYIGDAVFVRGARPDVEAAYPSYPQNDRAGWGYMLLTNFLPGGDGPCTLLAYAMDALGKETLLGSASITVDNAGAVKPFGAIDTPSQSGTAAGSSYVNFGWVLTPRPNAVPVDGSTITVWVDGLSLGHPSYNHYRADIATQFPGYANSNGAVGYFSLDTTGYADGLHTIAWSAVDNAGNADGIGSRYFTVRNASPSATPSTPDPSRLKAASVLPEDFRAPVFVRQGFAPTSPAELILPEEDGSLRVRIAPVSRIVLSFEDENVLRDSGSEIRARRRAFAEKPEVGRDLSSAAYEQVGDELRPLPVGASFDPIDGIFYWQPGPGFSGEYTIVFLKSGNTGSTKRTVKIVVGSPAAR